MFCRLRTAVDFCRFQKRMSPALRPCRLAPLPLRNPEDVFLLRRTQFCFLCKKGLEDFRSEDLEHLSIFLWRLLVFFEYEGRVNLTKTPLEDR